MRIDEDWMTPDELAKELGLSPQTLAQWRSEGRGPTFLKVGRRIVYERSDARAWAGAQRRTPTAKHARSAA